MGLRAESASKEHASDTEAQFAWSRFKAFIDILGVFPDSRVCPWSEVQRLLTDPKFFEMVHRDERFALLRSEAAWGSVSGSIKWYEDDLNHKPFPSRPPDSDLFMRVLGLNRCWRIGIVYSRSRKKVLTCAVFESKHDKTPYEEYFERLGVDGFAFLLTP